MIPPARRRILLGSCGFPEHPPARVRAEALAAARKVTKRHVEAVLVRAELIHTPNATPEFEWRHTVAPRKQACERTLAGVADGVRDLTDRHVITSEEAKG